MAAAWSELRKSLKLVLATVETQECARIDTGNRWTPLSLDIDE